MGRKNGGDKRGFMKATRRGREDEDPPDDPPVEPPEEAPGNTAQADATEAGAGDAHPAAAAFVQDDFFAQIVVSVGKTSTAVAETSGAEDGESHIETRGHMLQRHKRVRPKASQSTT
jgi:hypothetical protein